MVISALPAVLDVNSTSNYLHVVAQCNVCVFRNKIQATHYYCPRLHYYNPLLSLATVSFLCAVYGFSKTSYNISEMGRLSVPFAGTVKGTTQFNEDLSGTIDSTAGGTAGKNSTGNVLQCF